MKSIFMLMMLNRVQILLCILQIESQRSKTIWLNPWERQAWVLLQRMCVELDWLSVWYFSGKQNKFRVIAQQKTKIQLWLATIIGMSRENLFSTFMQTIHSEALKEREMLTRINGKNWKQFRPDNWSEMSLTEQAHWFQRQWLIPNPLVLPVSLAK